MSVPSCPSRPVRPVVAVVVLCSSDPSSVIFVVVRPVVVNRPLSVRPLVSRLRRRRSMSVRLSRRPSRRRRPFSVRPKH